MIRRILALAGVAVLGGCAAAQAPAPPPPAVTVVTFGDSVAAGTDCDCTPFPDLYARRLGARSLNLAQPGSTAEEVTAEMDTEEGTDAVRGASVVLLMAGANDLADAFEAGTGERGYAQAADVVQREITAAVARVRELRGPDCEVLVLGYWNVVEDGDVARTDYGANGVAEAASATRYADDALRRAAAAGGAAYLDTSAALRGPDGRANPTDLLAEDGDHPNARGQEAIAAAVYDVLPHPPQ
ncbi:SGNH/GDSL hydrolase family protein [Krasilnikovia cinnamomea]|uniref:SGNH/GDSL hydrolase family protein n=1 Tax=Krasilnikovia cinnamomea TaxID=349313 RepID=UPI001F5E88EC|nr:SGNH/GDSL hydrolase family protein [Krasilnikovia cinnamomea]